MIKLSDLTLKIKKWNMLGHSLLPPLELVIIASKSEEEKAEHIVQLFPTQQLHISDSDQFPKQRILIMRDKMYGRIHVLQGLSDPEIKDSEFRERKKAIQKYRRQKYLIFIVFTLEDKKQLQKHQDQLVEFGIVKNVDCVIHYDHIYNDSRLLHEILMKYENSFKYELVTNYRLMKQHRKQYEKSSKRYIEWKKVMKKQADPLTFSLMNFRLYSESMRSSFTGTYSTCHYELVGMGKSINWKVMELLHEFWEVQSDILFKQVDSFPLSYIEQKYKMSDHYSIGGFLPDTCFKAIFSPPLYQLRNSLMSTIENIKHLTLRHIQLALNYVFENTNIKEQYIQKELQLIENICDKFISELSNSLESQIQYIHANPEDFWNYRQLNSSFYSPDQQVYIQIKYIGKAYVRKVYESIKDAVPRFIGQGLLKKIEKHISQDSINTFIEATKDKQLQIILTQNQIQKYQADLDTLKDLDSLIAFFSLKVNASFLIKNFHEKKLKQWERMFGRNQKNPAQDRKIQVEQRGSLLVWMKNIFKKKNNKEERRANSGQKNIQKQAPKQEEKPMMKQENPKTLVINQKNWLLIINTGRQVSFDRIKQSAVHGFPTKFRSSIWMYLSTRNKQKYTKLKNVLKQKPNDTIVRQIQKDIPRTSPKQLFHYSMKSSLRNVLVGYSIHDKQIQYTQGMNFITSVILTTLIGYGEKSSPLVDNRINYEEVEEKAFCILKYIMEECGVRKLMAIQVGMLTDLSVRLTDRIKELSPQMLALIQKTPFNCEMIFSSPLISCLSNVTNNIALMRRFLDILITNDFFIVYRIIAQFVAHCEFMMNRLNPDNLYDFLKNKMYDEVYAIVGDEGLSKLFANL